MRFENSFLDEIRDRVPISSVIGAARLVGQEEDQRAARRLLGLLPVPRREEPELPLRGQEGPLPLLRLRRFGRPFPVPDRTRRRELSGGRRAHRRTRRRADAGARRAGRAAREAAHQPDRRHGTGDEVLPGPAAVGRRRQGPRLSARPRPDAGHAAVVPPRLCAGKPQCAEGVSRVEGRREGADRGLRAGAPRRRHPGLLRLFPRPHHVPDPGFARPHHRLRRPGARPRTRWRNT